MTSRTGPKRASRKSPGSTNATVSLSKTQAKSRERHLRRTYGIGEQEYSVLLERQKGVCYICERSPEELGARLCVDHDHHTGQIRGLLCRFCNRFVIGRHRNPVLFQRAALYLEQPETGWIVPPKVKRRKRRKK